MQLREIKGKIKAVSKTRQVTRAMEAVAAAKMRKSQERALFARPYALSAVRLLRRLSGGGTAKINVLFQKRPLQNILVVLITSDRGLAGSLNASVIKKTAAFIRENNLSKESVSFVCIGKKGYEYFEKRGYSISRYFEKVEDAPDLSLIEELSRYVFEIFGQGGKNHVFVAYSNFISTFAQEPKLHQVLPLSPSDIEEIVSGIVPVRGKYAHLYANEKESVEKETAYLFEPSEEEILKGLIFNLITVIFYHGILEARASEFSARMVAMRSASDKALEMGKALSLEYNKARQSAITREVSEIVSGVEALGS